MSIQKSIIKLENNISNLHRNLTDLISKLDPILLGVVPADEVASEQLNKMGCTLSNKLIQAAYELESIDNIVASLSNRLDLDSQDVVDSVR